MELIKNMRTFMLAILLGTVVSFVITSCSDDDDSTSYKRGTVSGTITDETGNPLEGVSVAISEVDDVVTTDSEGFFTVSDVTVKSHSVILTKKGRETISTTITANSFVNAANTASINVVMLDASSLIEGVVYDSRNGDAPFAGVTVSINAVKKTITAADGTFVLEDVRTNDYTITFEKEGYSSISRKITKGSFIDKTSALEPVFMGRVELLRGLTADDLASADKWYYNEYRGGRNGDAYPHWDWSTDYMSTLSFVGQWEEQNEGTTLQIRNNGSDRNNPADMDVFDSYTYGSKRITEDNKIMSLRVRTHSTSSDAPTYFGVQVVDLSQDDPIAVKIGDINTLHSEDYRDFEYDLSAYVGKEVIIAVGVYRQSEGEDYYKQLVLRAIRFANQKVEGWGWLPGKEVVSGWKLTEGMVRSTMVQTNKSFTGISPVSGNRDNYVDAYRAWRSVNHIAAAWTLVPLKKDPEVFPSEGYIIKTRNDAETSTTVPESYLYSKFAIGSGSNTLTLRTRNFSSNPTYFKLSVVEENGTVTHMSPKTAKANSQSAGADGCWKFSHESGAASDPSGYAVFTYDLSQFNGKNVVVTLGVYNCVANSGENKLAIYRVDLQ